jgi:hypothetical protein
MGVYDGRMVDMDILGTFHVVALGILAGPLVLTFSRGVRRGTGRSAVVLWFLFLATGLACGSINVLKHSAVAQDACSIGEIVTGFLLEVVS